jgi:hypothetical protein
MFRALVAAVALLAISSSANALDLVCVNNETEMIGAATKAGEKLQWMGLSNYEQPFWFFANWQKETYTVWFQLPDTRICTGGGYFGSILHIGANSA